MLVNSNNLNNFFSSAKSTVLTYVVDPAIKYNPLTIYNDSLKPYISGFVTEKTIQAAFYCTPNFVKEKYQKITFSESDYASKALVKSFETHATKYLGDLSEKKLIKPEDSEKLNHLIRLISQADTKAGVVLNYANKIASTGVKLQTWAEAISNRDKAHVSLGKRIGAYFASMIGKLFCFLGTGTSKIAKNVIDITPNTLLRDQVIIPLVTKAKEKVVKTAVRTLFGCVMDSAALMVIPNQWINNFARGNRDLYLLKGALILTPFAYKVVKTYLHTTQRKAQLEKLLPLFEKSVIFTRLLTVIQSLKLSNKDMEKTIALNLCAIILNSSLDTISEHCPSGADSLNKILEKPEKLIAFMDSIPLLHDQVLQCVGKAKAVFDMVQSKLAA